MLNWTQDATGAVANSCLHDDGSAFMYEFEKTATGWANMTPEELIVGPNMAVFPTLAEAKTWAESMEAITVKECRPMRVAE